LAGVISLSVLILAVSGAFRAEGPHALGQLLLVAYFPSYFVVIQFWGGVHNAPASAIPIALAVLIQNLVLWYLVFLAPRRKRNLRDI
jgi:hypothetical protein